MSKCIFAALADPHRREIIERLAQGKILTTGELLAGLPMTRQGASKHLAILEDAGLIKSTIKGRITYRELKPNALRGTQAWFNQIEQQWDQAVARLADSYSSTAPPNPTKPDTV
jgi:DNA-binding transcriptional ArsR family regulator